MGRRGPFAALLIVLTGAAATPQLREARWTIADQRIEALTRKVGECVRREPPTRDVAIGRVAFRTPLLFGGQAARTGLSCNSCHRSGGGNRHFVFPGISGAPGTADVTASLLSSHRGDGIFNPRPIPDLARDPPKVARDRLRRFIRGLVVEEFDGAEPSAAVLDGLTAYVVALDATACTADEAMTLAASVADVRAAAEAATLAIAARDAPTAQLMLAGARDGLGLIDERFAGHDAERKTLRRLDAGLRVHQHALGRQHWPSLAPWLGALVRAERQLKRTERQSLYSPERLSRVL